MAVIAFFTKRDLPSASCASALAAAGLAARGLRVARGIHGPGFPASSGIMPQCLPGVDAITSAWPNAGRAGRSIPDQNGGKHIILDFDIGLWAEAVRERSFDLAVLADSGAGSRFPSPGPACRAVFLPCSRFGSERPCLAEVPPLPVTGTWVPVLTRADVSSLASGAPLPRARAAAQAIARALSTALPAGHGAAAASAP